MNSACTLLLLISASMSEVLAAEEIRCRKVDGEFPKGKSEARASGSGLIIGDDLILTNRHVAQSDNGKSYDGFRVFVGPEYKGGIDARVISICDTYDLALLQTKETLGAKKLAVLDVLPALSTHVTAYGFPLGSQFGVGLTATGGQISRHPVTTFGEGKNDDASIKSALWHDAALLPKSTLKEAFRVRRTS